ncbi:MAG: response regulator, partial [Rhodocyclales bacterium]|nr:response regulator [Rhodocyclales bacterium]
MAVTTAQSAAERYSPATAQRDGQVVAELVRAAYGSEPSTVPSTVYANLFAVGILVLALFDRVPGMLLGTWVAAQLAYQIVRTVVYHRYWRQQPDIDSAPRWGRYFAWQTFANGCIWGTAGAIFFAPQAVETQALVAVLLCGMAAGSIPVTAMLRWAFYGSAGMILTPLVVRNFVEGGTYHFIFGGMLAVFLAFILNWGRTLNRLLTEANERRFDNLALVDLAEAAKQEAVEANIAKSKFLAAASHDLRQPLHALTLFTGALKEEEDGARISRLADNIDSSLTALSLLLNSLLDISKLDAGVVDVRVASIRLQDVFERLSVEFEPLASRKRLRLKVRETRAIVFTDRVLLERIVRNLLSNAIRYTESGGVLLACRRRRDGWGIEVRDSGIGISDDEQKKVFNEFYQIGNPERDRQKGLGLGLAIVARMSNLIGCPVSLRSAPGRGSVFAITVPAGKATALPVAAQVVTSCEGVRVLVIDDDAAALAAINALLDAWRCDTMTAESHADAVSRLTERQWEPDVVICDYQLRGGESGIDALDWMRVHFDKNLPCVLITGNIEAERLQRVRESGYPLLHKPVPPAKLRALLNGVLPKPQAS